MNNTRENKMQQVEQMFDRFGVGADSSTPTQIKDLPRIVSIPDQKGQRDRYVTRISDNSKSGGVGKKSSYVKLDRNSG